MTEKLSRTVSDEVAANIRRARKELGWSMADLAAHCAELGDGAEVVTENVIENIESGRRRKGERTRDITVDEVTVIAKAMGLPAAILFPPASPPPGFDPDQFIEAAVLNFAIGDLVKFIQPYKDAIDHWNERMKGDKKRGEKTIFIDPVESPFHSGGDDEPR